MKVSYASGACCVDISVVERSERVVRADDLVCVCWSIETG